jgi:hypothetical protein
MINFNGTTPAAPAGGTNVIPQNDGAGNMSFYVPNGPVVLAELALTGQTADVASTPLVTSANTGRFRVTVYIIVTTVDPSSSTLGAVELSWSDGDNSTSQTLALTTTQTGNSLTTFATGTALVNNLAATPLNISTSGYASNTPATMEFSLYVETELMS